MNIFWKHNYMCFSLNTKDNKTFRYCHVEYDKKKKLFGSIDQNILENKIKECIQKIFNIWVNQSWIFEGEDIYRLIDDKKLSLVNSHIRTFWRLDYQPDIKQIIENITITHLIR